MERLLLSSPQSLDCGLPFNSSSEQRSPSPGYFHDRCPVFHYYERHLGTQWRGFMSLIEADLDCLDPCHHFSNRTSQQHQLGAVLHTFLGSFPGLPFVYLYPCSRGKQGFVTLGHYLTSNSGFERIHISRSRVAKKATSKF